MSPPRPVLSLARARALTERYQVLGDLHRQGHHWVQAHFLAALRRLEGASRKTDRGRAALGWILMGHLHDLNGTPRAAIRAYQRALRVSPGAVAAWNGVGCMLDNMGHYQRARHALARAAKLAPDDEDVAAHLERVEWSLLNPCPVLYDTRSVLWHAAEALAAGRPNEAMALVARKRSARARQQRARIHGSMGNALAAVAEWSRIGSQGDRVQLQHADWYYLLRGPAADEPTLWKLMLWQIRGKLEGGAYHYPPSLAELDVTEEKRFELYVRYELARCEGDVATLVALAGNHPSWREPGETALRLGTGKVYTIY